MKDLPIPEDEYRELSPEAKAVLAQCVAAAATKLGFSQSDEEKLMVLAELSNNSAQYVAYKSRALAEKILNRSV